MSKSNLTELVGKHLPRRSRFRYNLGIRKELGSLQSVKFRGRKLFICLLFHLSNLRHFSKSANTSPRSLFNLFNIHWSNLLFKLQ
jgi:hypothetical protein